MQTQEGICTFGDGHPGLVGKPRGTRSGTYGKHADFTRGDRYQHYYDFACSRIVLLPVVLSREQGRIVCRVCYHILYILVSTHMPCVCVRGGAGCIMPPMRTYIRAFIHALADEARAIQRVWQVMLHTLVYCKLLSGCLL